MSLKIYYEVIDSHGVKMKGEYVGEYNAFIKFIKNNGYFLISYNEKKISNKKQKFKNKDYIYFLEEIYYLVSSGMSIDRALKNLINSSSFDIQKKFYNSIYDHLKGGETFSHSIEKAAEDINFDVDELSILLINTNETVGDIAQGLKISHDHIAFKESINNEIKQALGYPIFLIIMSVLMVFFVFIFIVPRFASIFTPAEFNKLPFLSKTILETGLFVNQNLGYIMISLLIAALLSIFYYKKMLKIILNNVLIKLKKFKNMLVNLQLSYFFGAMSLMQAGGIDIKRALKESSKIVTFKPLKDLINKSYELLKRGEKLSESLKGSELIEMNTISLISAAENSSNLVEVFDSISKRYIDMFEKDVKSFLALLEPVVIVFMGGVIAVIVVSIMLAIMSINNIAG